MKVGSITTATGKIYKALRQKVYNTTHFAELDAQKPQVHLGWYRKVKCTKEERKATGQKYKLVEATMSKEQYEKIQKDPLWPLRKMFYGGMLAIGAMSLKSHVDAAKYLEKAPKAIVANIEKAKKIAQTQDSIVSDGKIALPWKLAQKTQSKTNFAGKFYSAIRDNKENLMKDLGVDSITYDRLAKVAMQIANEESKYGASKSYKIYDAVESSQTGRDIVSAVRMGHSAIKGVKIPAKEDGILSMGLTRFKIDAAKPEEKALFKKYGITYGENSTNIQQAPEKSAIATIIHLAALDKDYPIYASKVDSLMPDTLDFNVMKSISNAKHIIFDDVRRPLAKKAITEDWHGVTNEAQAILYPDARLLDVSEKDIQDLKTYARTVKLSPAAYLAARWNGRKILPTGTERQQNQAYENLINIIAQKGYVSNIDKTSKIDY